MLHLEPTEITESGDVWYEIGGTRLMLYPSQFAGTNQATAVNIRVDDVEVSVAELKARGAVFETYDFGDVFRTVDGIATSAAGEKMAWLKDPDPPGHPPRQLRERARLVGRHRLLHPAVERIGHAVHLGQDRR